MSISTAARGQAPVRRAGWVHRVVALVLVLTGGVVTGWPVVETLLNNDTGAAAVSSYVNAVAASSPGPVSEALDRAHAYNAALSPGALWDPWGDNTSNNSPAHDAYLAQLNAFAAMGRIRIPQINVDLPIFHDATKQSLAMGAGHMFGTSLPVGGPDTHAVIAGHSGMKNRTVFDRLPEVKLGQTFFIDVYGTTLTYRVDQIVVVEPWQLEAVQRVPGADNVTLVTCFTPPGGHRERMLVRGVRVPDVASSSSQTESGVVTVEAVTADTSILGWMWPRILAAGGSVALVIVLGVSWIVASRRTRGRRSGRGVTRVVPADLPDDRTRESR